jgi:imidazolonepropionase-like amidohydrolase
VVEGNKIARIGDDAAFETRLGDRVVVLDGASLMPGMVRGHWHGSYDGLDFEPPPLGLERPPGCMMLLAAKHAPRP